MIKAPRGTIDILPPETLQWAHLEHTLREVSHRYNYQEIRTPVFEQLELFSRTVGDSTDIVQKEMYAFKDKVGRDLALRPELTAPVARAFLEHGMAQGALPRKFFYIGPAYRYEKPQAGRYREFRTFGVEVLGSPSPYSDVEVIMLAMDVAKALGLTGTQLTMNSIGCKECRGEYRRALVDYLAPKEAQLCPDCRSRLQRNPLRVLDCKNDKCKEQILGAPKTFDYLCEDCGEHWETVSRLLESQGIAFAVDNSLVRGLDYYTRTVFELKWPPLGAQDAILGGGRYDGLVEEIGGPPTPAVGFGLGMERLLLATSKGTNPITPDLGIDVFIVGVPGSESSVGVRVLGMAKSIRALGLSCEFDPMQRSLKAQMKQADRAGARFAVIVGEREIEEGFATLRTMGEGRQKEVPLEDVAKIVCGEVEKLGK